VDRPRSTVARSETAQWFSHDVLEYIGQRWREDARARLSPLPGSLVTVTSPPIMRASLRERARPSPSRRSGARSGNPPG